MVIYRVVKCEIDLPTMRYESYTGVDNHEKCQKVLKSVELCDTIGHTSRY